MHQHHALVAALVEERQHDLRAWRPPPRRYRWIALTTVMALAVPMCVVVLAVLRP